MRDLFKKSWFLGTLILGLKLVVFLSILTIISSNMASPFEGDTIWVLGSEISEGLSDGAIDIIFAFFITLIFYGSLIPIISSVLSFFRKKNGGFIFSIIYFLIFEVILIAFQVMTSLFSTFSVILMAFNVILIVAMFVFYVMRKKMLNLTNERVKSEKEIELSKTKIPLMVLITISFSVVVFLTTFFIPLYSIIDTTFDYHAVLINVLLTGETDLETVIFFFLNLFMFLSIFFKFVNCLSLYFFNKEKFIIQSKKLITLNFVATLIFFVAGLAISMYYTIEGFIAYSDAFIPVIMMIIVLFVYAILNGKFNAIIKPIDIDQKAKPVKTEPLIYIVLLTAITCLMLFLPIIKIEVTSSVLTSNVNLTGLDMLMDYPSLDPGYRVVAFVLVVMLIFVSICFVLTVAAYLSRYRQFSSIVRFAAASNVFFVFIVAISGYYFQIAKEINMAMVREVFDLYGISLSEHVDLDYTIGTDAVYALLASVFVLVMMFSRKAFDGDDVVISDTGHAPIKTAPEVERTSPVVETSNEEESHKFDPCPAFTELDSKILFFKKDLDNRKAVKVKDPSLDQLVNFIVSYAANSRLHLSYTQEDIATFIAGLGASRLSILQGMSGTGKTSLPKIFSEAIFGNCEIVEVESSWKDKNELLGYYNEFSLKFTPKKFTLALYKASLNRDITTFVLLDEMNLSRIEYYFSDFLSLMENEEDQRELKLINVKLNRIDEGKEIEYAGLSEGNTIKIPPNVWFIGTANRDESTFVISDKVYDRAHTINFIKRAPKIRNYSSPISKQFYDYHTISELFLKAKQNGDFDAENSDLIKKVETLLEPYNISFGNRILNQIEDFVNIYKACFDNKEVENKAVEKILLSKVVAKLEVKTIDDKDKLETEFKKLNLNQCAAFINRLDNE